MNIYEDLTYSDEFNKGYCYNLYINNEKKGYCNIIINDITKSSIITDFYCMKTNCGFGSILLKYLIEKIRKTKINIILLDDMSDRYRNSHNIYLKFGFRYISKTGPEMELKINNIGKSK